MPAIPEKFRRGPRRTLPLGRLGRTRIQKTDRKQMIRQVGHRRGGH